MVKNLWSRLLVESAGIFSLRFRGSFSVSRVYEALIPITTFLPLLVPFTPNPISSIILMCHFLYRSSDQAKSSSNYFFA